MSQAAETLDVGLRGPVGGFPVLDELVHWWWWVGKPFIFAVPREHGVVVR